MKPLQNLGDFGEKIYNIVTQMPQHELDLMLKDGWKSYLNYLKQNLGILIISSFIFIAIIVSLIKIFF